MRSAATAQIAHLDRQPLAALLRDRIDGDAELRRLSGELKNWLLRGVEWWDHDRRPAAQQRLHKLAPGMPRLIQVAGFTVETISAAYASPRSRRT